MKIYFAGAIRGGRDYNEVYQKLISHLKRYGKVLTEHIGENKITELGEIELSDKEIYERDIRLLREADILVAEVSTPSLGVGYEIGKAEEMNKIILCLYDRKSPKKLSAMIRGNPNIKLITYESLEEAKRMIDEFFISCGYKKPREGFEPSTF